MQKIFTRHNLFKSTGFYFPVLLSFCFFLSSCLTVPETPNTEVFDLKTQLFLFQKGQSDSSNLKAFPDSSFTLKIKISPDSIKKHLSFFWIFEKDTLSDTDSFFVKAHSSPLPQYLLITDPEKNTLRIPISIHFNTPPMIHSITTPEHGDSLFGNENTALLFSWSSSDPDPEENLSHFIQIDDLIYSTGASTTIRQSGFSEGEHYFRVWVTDSLGDSDTSSFQSFYFYSR